MSIGTKVKFLKGMSCCYLRQNELQYKAYSITHQLPGNLITFGFWCDSQEREREREREREKRGSRKTEKTSKFCLSSPITSHACKYAITVNQNLSQRFSFIQSL